MTLPDNPILNYCFALGIGLLIGAERERRKGTGPNRASMGIRTFAAVSLLGAVSVSIGNSVLLSVMAVAVTGLTVMAYRFSYEQDPGLTTEIALLLTLLLGGLSMNEPALASAVAVILAILLNVRNFLHRFVSSVLSESELNDALILAAAALVLLPLAPDSFLGPFNAFNPRTVWKIVILIMTINGCGYIALRLMGARIGLPIAGFTSGFVSSAATISSMGARAKQEVDVLWAAVAGAVLSTVATFIQLAVVLQVTNQQALLSLWLPLVCACATAVAYGTVIMTIALHKKVPEKINLGQPLSLKTAFIFAVTVSIIIVLAAAFQHWLGNEGVIAAAAIGGFADTHSAAVAVASLVSCGKLSASETVLPILISLTTNTVTKAMLAVLSGNKPFAVAVIPGLILVILAAWAGAAFSLGYF